MSSSHEPAHSIIVQLAAALGEPAQRISAVARALGIKRQTVWKWTAPKSRNGGTGGLIPPRYHREILQLAGTLGVPLTLESFLPESSPPSVLGFADGSLAPAPDGAGVLSSAGAA